tara:strand:- start:1108 stop:1605 length:498 start_codon:yes stop_codon:yes gene_type:complete
LSNRVGIGFDSHALVHGRDFVLGGIVIDFPLGPQGHSDGDPLIHSLIDAMLGAAALGDIGEMFPESDPAIEGQNSVKLLLDAYNVIQSKNLRISNADATIYADEPPLAPYRKTIESNLSDALGIEVGRINLKFKTLEGLTFPLKADAKKVVVSHSIVSLELADNA